MCTTAEEEICSLNHQINSLTDELFRAKNAIVYLNPDADVTIMLPSGSPVRMHIGEQMAIGTTVDLTIAETKKGD
jgi:hypothetical protein